MDVLQLDVVFCMSYCRPAMSAVINITLTIDDDIVQYSINCKMMIDNDEY